MTLADYDELAGITGGCCGICDRATASALAVDHDHRTHQVRGVLCIGCNVRLGNGLGDLLPRTVHALASRTTPDDGWVHHAAQYLANPPVDRHIAAWGWTDRDAEAAVDAIASRRFAWRHRAHRASAQLVMGGIQ